jgi:fatty acid desaturase
MKPDPYPIPAKLNLLIAATQFSALLALLWTAGKVTSWWSIALVAVTYGLVMNSAYALLHEAEHGILHPNRRLNDGIGAALALFFPAPFHLIRQGHIGHHMRNRSDDEAFDFYFEGENPVWKWLQLYGTLTGLFWIVIALSNFVALLFPFVLKPKNAAFDRPTEALLESLNPKFQRLIRIEAFCAILLHATLLWWWQVPILHYLAVLFGFGVIWSALQYVHHFGTTRDVRKGARNLKTFSLLDILWLNHNWHLNHHLSPTVPWPYLPFIYQGEEFSRGSLFRAYLRMWRGPRFTRERVQNRYAGKIIN